MSTDTPLKTPTFLERVAAATPNTGPAKALFFMLAAPFYILGLIVGAVWQVGVNAYGAIKVGIADARDAIKAA